MNPLKAIRQEQRLTRAEAAAVWGLDYQTLALGEAGYFRALPPRILDALAGAGHDADELQAAYCTWREARGRAALAGVRVG